MDGTCPRGDYRFSRVFSSLAGFIGPEAEEWIRSAGKPREYSKGEIFLRAGEQLDSVLFVMEGIFKYYYVGPNGDERIKHFVDEGNFVLSASAFLERSPSRFFIQALEPSAVLAFPSDELRRRAAPGGVLNRAFGEYLARSLLEKEEREADFLFMDGKARYESFMERKPALAARLRQFEIAAYLGIDPAHLSRIRASR